LNLEEEWKYDLAAMLSQIGCITLPLQIVDKVYSGEKLSEEENALFQQHPNVAKKLIANIPRLQSVAYMIASQLKNYSEFPPGKTTFPL
jgi:response regulator RpfG family c-di-GMP phosphodiesterase